MRLCKKCNVVKDLSEFYAYRSDCKSCFREYVKQYRASEKGKEVRKKEAISARLNGKQQARQKRYEVTDKGIEAIKRYEAKRNSSKEGKAKLAAKSAVSYALKVGKLIKQPCWLCGENMSQAHHSSYEKDMRLAVVWLCSVHHNEIHNPRRV